MVHKQPVIAYVAPHPSLRSCLHPIPVSVYGPEWVTTLTRLPSLTLQDRLHERTNKCFLIEPEPGPCFDDLLASLVLLVHSRYAARKGSLSLLDRIFWDGTGSGGRNVQGGSGMFWVPYNEIFLVSCDRGQGGGGSLLPGKYIGFRPDSAFETPGTSSQEKGTFPLPISRIKESKPKRSLNRLLVVWKLMIFGEGFYKGRRSSDTTDLLSL